MRNDTEKLCIAVCGPLPGAVELMKRRDDVEYTAFPNGNELYDCLEDAAPFDFIVIQSNAGAGIVPLYYPGCDGNCYVYLTADPQSAEDVEALDEMIDTQLNEKWFRLSPASSRIEREDVLIYKLNEGVEAVERDGVPGLRLGDQEQYAKDTLQAWLIDLLLEKPWTGGELASRMAKEKSSEVESILAKKWTEPGKLDGREVLGHLKDTYERARDENAIHISKLALRTFLKDFCVFLCRETPPFTFVRETA